MEHEADMGLVCEAVLAFELDAEFVERLIQAIEKMLELRYIRQIDENHCTVTSAGQKSHPERSGR